MNKILLVVSVILLTSSFALAELGTNISILYGWNGTAFVPLKTSADGKLQTDMNFTQSIGLNPKINNSYTIGNTAYQWLNGYFINGTFSENLTTQTLTVRSGLNLPNDAITDAMLVNDITIATTNDATIGSGWASGGTTLYANGDVWMNGSLFITGNITTVDVQNFNVTGYMRPAVNNTYDLGGANLQWRNFYAVGGNVSGNINLATGGGNVGIGTTTASGAIGGEKVRVLDSGDVAILLESTGTGTPLGFWRANSGSPATVDFGTEGSEDLAIFTASGERVRIDTSGRIGINVTSPQHTLHVNGSANFTNRITPGQRNIVINPAAIYTTNGGVNLLITHDDPAITLADASAGENDFTIYNSNGVLGIRNETGTWSATDAYFAVIEGGNVGIGTTSPGSEYGFSPALTIQGSGSPGIVFNDTNGDEWSIGTSSSNLNIAAGSTERLRIDSTGNVGIGMTAPSAKLEINGTGNVLKVNGTTLLAISGGNVGIGTTGPADILEIAKAGETGTYISSYSTTDTTSGILYLRKSASGTLGTKSETASGETIAMITAHGVNTGSNFNDVAQIQFIQDGASGATRVPGRIVFNTATNAAAPAERMRIDSNGSVGIKDNEFYIGTVNLNPGGGNGGGTFHWNTEVANSQSVNITPSIDYNTQKNGAMIVARIKSARRGATPTSTAWGEITGYYSSQGSNVSFIKKHGFNEGSGITLLDGTFKWVTSGSTAQIQYTADGDAYGEHLSIVGEFSNSYGSD